MRCHALFVLLMQTILQIDGQISRLGKINLIKGVFSLLFIVLLDYFNMLSADYIVIGLSIISILLTIRILKGTSNFSMKYVKVISEDENYKVLLYYIVMGVSAQLEIPIIDYFYNDDTLAEYGVAFRFYMILMLLMPAVTNAQRLEIFKKICLLIKYRI